MRSAVLDAWVTSPWWPRVWSSAPRAHEPIALAAAEIDRHAIRLVAAGGPRTEVRPFAALPELLRAGDLLVVNDAATLPGSLAGTTSRGEPVEVRLLAVDGTRLDGIVFGAGDWRTRTEDRDPPPPLVVGDRLQLGALGARVVELAGRRIALEAELAGDALWEALYAIGVPVQYAHRTAPLDLWSVQTAYAARPWAAEMPSAGRGLTWSVLLDLRRAGVELATLTHAAGLSATGDDELDRVLPLPERYEIPTRTAGAVERAKQRGRRVIAVGTTVVRALEASRARAGEGIATGRIDATTRLEVVDGLVSGLHVPGESHFELLRAFISRDRLERALAIAAANGLSAHELGDAMLVLPSR